MIKPKLHTRKKKAKEWNKLEKKLGYSSSVSPFKNEKQKNRTENGMFFHKFPVFLGNFCQIFYPKKMIATFPLWILEKGGAG